MHIEVFHLRRQSVPRRSRHLYTNAETRPERPQKVFPRDYRARYLFYVRRDPVQNTVWGQLIH